MSKQADEPSEVQLLLCGELLAGSVNEKHVVEHPIDAKPGAGRFYRIAGDLWQKHVNHCQGVALLLGQGLIDSAMVVNRAAYETAITLTYLRRVGDRARNAALFEAHMVLDTAAVFTDEAGKVPEKAQRAIAAIPKDILDEATKNRKARLSWSGKTLAQMADAIEVTGHRFAYAVMSWPSHARFAGQGLERIQHPGGDVEWRFGTTAKADDFEAVANHTRRMMHRMYFAVTHDFYGATLPLATRTPFTDDESPLGA